MADAYDGGTETTAAPLLSAVSGSGEALARAKSRTAESVMEYILFNYFLYGFGQMGVYGGYLVGVETMGLVDHVSIARPI